MSHREKRERTDNSALAGQLASSLQRIAYGGALWIVNLPRSIRVIIAGIFGIAVTLAFMPIVDALYIDNLFYMGAPVLPALVSAGLGMVTYIVGWRLIVGTVGERPPLRPATVVYVWGGVFFVALIAGLVVYGIALNLQAE